MSVVSTWSLTSIGIQCSEPTGPPVANAASSRSASSRARLLMVCTAFSAGPDLSYSWMRLTYCSTSARHVTCFDASAARTSSMVASTR